MASVKKILSNKKLPKLSNLAIILLASQYYRAIMPNKKGHRIAIWVAFLSASTIIALQMLYPLDRAVPFAFINGTSIGFMANDEMAKLLTDQFDKTKVKLVVQGGKSIEYPIKSAGAEPNTERMIAQLSEYPFWQRFIPLSILWQMPNATQADVYYSETVLQRIAQENSTALNFAPTNARLALKDGKLIATTEKAGYEVTAKRVKEVLSGARLRLGATTTVEVPAKRLPAARTMHELSAVQAQAEAALARQVAVKAADKVYTPDKSEVAAWLILDTAADGAVALRTDTDRIKTYIESINKQVATPAGQTDITVVNGQETGRKPGTPGRAINAGVLADQITAFILKGQGKSPFAAQFVEVQPSVIFNSRYTATQEGLQAYLDDTGRSRNVQIMVRQLDGGKWAASTRANESIPSGSTYKLYVALMLFDKMKKGETRWEDPMLDTTVSGCFDRMTIASTNPCAEKWLAEWGRTNINNFIYSHGFSAGTTFTSSIANHSTAADLTKYMIGLNDGSLVSEPYRSRLLHSLSVHPYRYGIPTGSKGRVQDKVGFLWDYVHDTAIVHHPRGTYVMTIMTKGQSYAAIASITREVERIMYP